MRNHFISLLTQKAQVDEKLIFLTGDLGYSVVEPLAEILKNRFINAGIAEANMTTMASALAADGFSPYLYSIVPFVTMRCFEQIRNDVCYHRRAVRIVGIGAGFSYGALGPSHHALEDATVLSALPNLVLVNPASTYELDILFAYLYKSPDAVYYRLPKDDGPTTQGEASKIVNGAYTLKQGNDLNLIVSGALLTEALSAVKNFERSNICSIKIISVPVLNPFPAEAFLSLLCPAPILTAFEGYHDNPLAHGVLKAVMESGWAQAHPAPYRSLCVPKIFPKKVGDQAHLREAAGLSIRGFEEAICSLLQRKCEV